MMAYGLNFGFAPIPADVLKRFRVTARRVPVAQCRRVDRRDGIGLSSRRVRVLLAGVTDDAATADGMVELADNGHRYVYVERSMRLDAPTLYGIYVG